MTPLALEGDVLRIGLSSESDLEAFKRDGADPLRQALFGAFGVQLRYVPVKISAQVAREKQPAAGAKRDQGALEDSEEPHRADIQTRHSQASTDPQFDPVMDRVARVVAQTEQLTQEGRSCAAEPHRQARSVDVSTVEPQLTAAERAEALGLNARDSVNTRDSVSNTHEQQASTFGAQTAMLGSRAQAREPEGSAAPHATPEQKSAEGQTPQAGGGDENSGNLAPGSEGSEIHRHAVTDGAETRASEEPVLIRYGEAVIREMFDVTLLEDRPLPENRG